MRSAETAILRELIAAGNGFVSGNRIAAFLRVSRVAVWSHMERLREAGFSLEAKPRAGYRIISKPTGLYLPLLRAHMPAWRDELPIFCHEEIDSTNSDAERRMAAGEPTPFVILARRQTAGRGRLGRVWFSADEGNLYVTFAFRPMLSLARMRSFTLWVGASICRLLNEVHAMPARLKWPNDLLIDGCKVGGILTEARIDSDRIRDLILGIGINVNGAPSSWPEEITAVATSMAGFSGRLVDLNEFAACLIDHLFTAYESFVGGRFRADFDALWRRYDALRGRDVSATHGNTVIEGRAGGIDEEGRLRVTTASGEVVCLSAGDVTLRKDAIA